MKGTLAVAGLLLAVALLLGCVGGQQPAQEQQQGVQNITENASQQGQPEAYSSEQQALEDLEQVLTGMEEEAAANATGEIA